MKYIRYYCVLALLFVIVMNIQAQFTVSGTVKLESGEEAVGVTLRLLNSKIGAITDVNGKFNIKSKHNSDILVVTYVGYHTDSIKVTSNKPELSVVLREQTEQVGDVVVIGRTYTSMKSRNSVLLSEKVNYGELCRAACCNLSESFETNASVDVSYSDAATGAKQIRLLGLPGTYVQMLTENIPNFRGAAQHFGLDYVPASWMDNIQISKGCSSVRNGYESVTGQINVEYKKPITAAPLTVTLFGSDTGKMEGNVDGAIILSKKLSTGIFANYSRDKESHDANGDGFLDMPLTEQYNFMNRWYYKNGDFTSQVGGKFVYETRENGQTGHAAHKNFITPYGIDIKTLRGEFFTKNGYLLNEDNSSSIALIVAGSYHKQDSKYGNINYDLKQSNVYANFLFDSEIGMKSKISTGATLNIDITDQASDFWNAQPSFVKQRNEYVVGIFAEYTWIPLKNLTVLAGLRGDHHNEYGYFVTPRLHVRYEPIEQIHLRASVGKGYRSVNVYVENNYLFASNRVNKFEVAPDLKMESALNWGASVTGYIPIAGKDLTITAEYYQTDFQRQVVTDVMSDAHGVSFYNLDGRSYARNIQLEASYSLFKGLDLRGAWRWTDSKMNYNGKMMDKPLLNKYKGLLTAGYKTPKGGWQFDVTSQFNGGGTMPTVDAAAPLWSSNFKSYTIVNSQITKYIKKLSLYVGVENIFDFTQSNPIIGSDDPWGNTFDSTLIWGPIHGRKIYGGMRWSL